MGVVEVDGLLNDEGVDFSKSELAIDVVAEARLVDTRLLVSKLLVA